MNKTKINFVKEQNLKIKPTNTEINHHIQNLLFNSNLESNSNYVQFENEDLFKKPKINFNQTNPMVKQETKIQETKTNVKVESNEINNWRRKKN